MCLYYNGISIYLFVNDVEICKFEAKVSEINAAPLFGNVSKDVSTDSMKNTGLYGYVYDFWDDYDSIDVDEILNIYK